MNMEEKGKEGGEEEEEKGDKTKIKSMGAKKKKRTRYRWGKMENQTMRLFKVTRKKSMGKSFASATIRRLLHFELEQY